MTLCEGEEEGKVSQQGGPPPDQATKHVSAGLEHLHLAWQLAPWQLAPY